MDAGFASAKNQHNLVGLGVKDVAFAKNSRLDVNASVTSVRVHRNLMKFRASIEAAISWLKRSFGLRRCSWSGATSFAAYIWASVAAQNLLRLARLTS